MNDARSLSLGLLAAVATVGLWSGFILISRFGVSHQMAPWDLAALRFGVSGLVMAPVLLRLGLGGLGIGRACLLAASGGLGFALFAYHGFVHAPAAHGAVLMPGTLPLYTAILAVAVLGERLPAAKWAALALILIGVVGLGGGALATGDSDAWRGDLLFLAASFCWAWFTIWLRRWQVAPMRATALVAVMTACLYLPVYALALEGQLAEVPVLTLAYQGFYQGICAVVLALFTFSTAVRHLGVTTTTMITAATPAVAALGAALLLGEALTLPIALGVAAVIAGGLWSALIDRRQRRGATGSMSRA